MLGEKKVKPGCREKDTWRDTKAQREEKPLVGVKACPLSRYPGRKCVHTDPGSGSRSRELSKGPQHFLSRLQTTPQLCPPPRAVILVLSLFHLEGQLGEG